VRSDQGRARRRILVLSGIFPNRRDETWGIHVFQNVRALSGHAEVRVVAPVPLVPRILAHGRYKAYTGIPRHDNWKGIPVVYPRFFVVPKIGRFLHGFGLFTSIFPAVAREIRTFRPHALLAYFAFPYGFAAVRFGALFKLPVVVSCRGGDINYMAAPRLQGRLIVRSLRACRRVLVMSDAMRTRVIDLGVDPHRVEVVGNGIDAQAFAPADPTEARRELGVDAQARVAVCLSRLTAEKRIDVLVDALAGMDGNRPRVFVVGDGVERTRLRDRIDAAGLTDVVTLLGTRPHAEVPRWIAAADLVVLPSRNEGMPNAVLEALACGRPVVATAVGGTPELVNSATLGRLVSPGDPGALARAISEALQQAWDPAAISASVRSRTWDAVGARTAAFVTVDDAPGTSHPAAARREHNTWNAETR